jgi:signal transduction histidine kinase
MPTTWLNNYGPSNLEVLFLLFVIGALIVAGYWLLRRRWQENERQLQLALDEAQRQCGLVETLHKNEMDEIRARYDPVLFKTLQDHHQQVIAHEFMKGLHFIVSQSEDAVTELRADQLNLRDNLNKVRAKAYDMIQHVENIVELPNLEQNAEQRELVNLRGLLEGVAKELFPYAETWGVSLRPDLRSMEPILANRLLIAHLCSNIIHNAIKYSSPGGVVTITLRLHDEGEKQAVIEVRDQGRGIEAKEQERIFQLHVRGDGLVEPGSGLGLYYARRIARLHGGDLVLIESKSKEGSTFRITLPYSERNGAQ